MEVDPDDKVHDAHCDEVILSSSKGIAMTL